MINWGLICWAYICSCETVFISTIFKKTGLVMQINKQFDKLYEKAIEIRNFEIELFWKRSNYFLILNIAIATGIFIKTDDNTMKLPLIILGIISSIFWVGINLGSKFWQDRWENKLAEIEEKEFPDNKLFSISLDESRNDVAKSFKFDPPRKYFFLKRITNFLILQKPSVSRIMISLSYVFTIFWIFVLFFKYFNNINLVQKIHQLNIGVLQMDMTTILTIISNFLAVLLGVLISFFITKSFETQNQLKIQKDFIKLIQVEVTKNVELMNQIVKEINNNIIPLYTLQTFNKESIWSSLINFKTIDTNLLNSISRSYFEYNLINRTLDIANYSGKFALVGNNTLGLVQAEINRSESLLKMMTLRNKDRHITGSCRSVSTLLR
ncbi:MAG TPA: hypothetical protein PKM07_00215 [Spirochaetota bacterium]|jgi:hypothetical protein|nr:hypothetical protein [Spirochaetota bacterium]HOH35987.1 hypothetical protein [Spirochaetota bacterium]HPJ13544.1 hypothetical protein [Spirochaetota bacterium]HPY03388.1 hypothetical protein [Spirochaetota bacterium]